EPDRDAKFEPDKGDMAPRIYGGAAGEKKGGGRVLVIGSGMFARDDFVAQPDMAMLKKGYAVARFPGNGELFTNGIFWLSKMDTMLAISPAAMEAPRIAPMPEPTLKAWRGVVVAVL